MIQGPLSRRAPGAPLVRRRRSLLASGLVVALAAGGLSLAGPVAGASGAVELPVQQVAQAKPKPGKGHKTTKSPQAVAAHKQWAAWVPPAGASFNTPRASYAAEYRNEARVIDAINHARRGSIIRMAMFSFDRYPVSEALIRARDKRKVKVQVIINNHEKPGAQVDMERAFGPRYRKRAKGRIHSFYYQCRGDGNACRGDGDVQHSKFILFSHTGAAKNVVMLGSLNMKENGAVNQFNDLLTINKSPGLFRSLDETFKQMRNDKVLKKPLKDETFGKYRLWTMPFARSRATKATEWRWGRDPINKILQKVKCTGARTDSGRTIIRVDMHAWSDSRGEQIANRFRDLHDQGCDVKIMIGYAQGPIQRIFARKTRHGFVPVRSTGFDTDEDGEIDLYSHQKILMINGNYDGKRDRKIVVTGSSNYQHGGQYGDELILKVDSARIYRQYADNWGRMYYSKYTHAFAFNGGIFKRNAAGKLTYVPPTLSDGGLRPPDPLSE